MKTIEEKRAYQRDYARTHKAENAERSRQWRAKHPEEWRKLCRDNMRKLYIRKQTKVSRIDQYEKDGQKGE